MATVLLNPLGGLGHLRTAPNSAGSIAWPVSLPTEFQALAGLTKKSQNFHLCKPPTPNSLGSIARQIHSRRSSRPRQILRYGGCRTKKNKIQGIRIQKTKSWQHPKDFPSGPPPQYYPGPATVNFGVLKRSGVFVAVWPPANMVFGGRPGGFE